MARSVKNSSCTMFPYLKGFIVIYITKIFVTKFFVMRNRLICQGLYAQNPQDKRSDFIHSLYFPSDKLDDNLVQLGTLAQGFYPWSYGISVDLLRSFIPLNIGFLL